MSIGSILRTSVSGMNAQATRLGTVSENIANSDTTGYKQSQTEFSSLILPANSAGYNSGAVDAHVRTLVSEQGGISYTGNDNNPKRIDLAVDGNGFLAVSDGSGSTYLTRAGAFTMQSDGSMVNAAGYTLMGYPVSATGTDYVLNGYQGLQEVNLKTAILSANPSTEGKLTVPLDKNLVAGAVATNAQTANFAWTGTSTVGDTLTFDVAVDGGTAITVTLTETATKSLSSLTSADIKAAINATAGLEGVASVNSSGNLVLTSNGDLTATESTLVLSNFQSTLGGTTAATTATGFTAFSAVGVAATSPAANTALPKDASTRSTSITVYTNSGEAKKLDIYYTKTSDSANTWEMSVFDSSTASKGLTTSPFPYGSSGSAPLTTGTLNFDGDTYNLASISGVTGGSVSNETTLNIDLSSIGGSTLALDIGNTTQFSGQSQSIEAKVNGNPAEVISEIAIAVDGTVTASFKSGATVDLFKIPLALVGSPDSMAAKAGNVYSAGVESGTVLMGFGGSEGFGNLTAGALEDSTVDLASELTTMIESQRSYTANSKVFQTGSEILDVLVNLKR